MQKLNVGEQLLKKGESAIVELIVFYRMLSSELKNKIVVLRSEKQGKSNKENVDTHILKSNTENCEKG